MRPKLPREIALLLPEDVERYIYKFLPKEPKPKKPSISPQLEKDLKYIQSMRIRGISAMYLKELEDFVLD